MIARWSTRTRRIVSASLLLALVLLTACSYAPGPPTILPLPTLQGPGLKKLSLFAALHPAFITSLTVATPAGQSSPLVFAAVDQRLYTGHLDGSGQREINIASMDCFDPAFTTDQQWIMCSGETSSTGYENTLEIASLQHPTSYQASDIHIAHLPEPLGLEGSTTDPMISPDGRMVAVTFQNAQIGSCYIQVYRTQPPYTIFSLLYSIVNACGSFDWWSPDGQYFLLDGPDRWYLVPVHYLLTALSSGAVSGGVLSIPSADVFAPFEPGAPIAAIAWGPGPNEFTYATGNNATSFGSIFVVNILTGRERILYSDSPSTPGYLGVSGMAWAPNGSQLVFSVKGPGCVDCNAYHPAQLYSFTPSLAQPPH